MTLWTVAHQAPRSMGFPRQEYWSGLSFPSPGDLPNPGIKLLSPELAWGKPRINLSTLQNRLPRGSDGKESACGAVGSLGQEDVLEKGIVTHSSILAWIIPWSLVVQPMRLQRAGHD